VSSLLTHISLILLQVLTKLELADKYEGNTDINGEDYNIEYMGDGPRPFRCCLDVGLVRTTTGNRVFGVLKGATDGGLDIPHSETRFVGYDSEGKSLDADKLREYIFGGHVANYMRYLSEEDEAKYQRQFSGYVKAGVTADMMEDMYKSAHEKIRADPTFTKKERKPLENQKRWNRRKLTLAQRRAIVKQKKDAFLNQINVKQEDNEDDD
jgi:large subunit ribosomal protein L5e